MTILQGVILGLVQGLSEFLPISSSGHIAILEYFFEIDPKEGLVYSVLLHFGTLISVFLIYWKDIKGLVLELIEVIKDIYRGRGLRVNLNPTRRLGFMIIVTSIPTAIFAVIFESFFEKLYGSLFGIGIGLIFTAILLLVSGFLPSKTNKIRKMKFLNGIFIGVMQAIAVAPGVSRSGSTLFASLVSGLERKFAVKYIFLISIPPILGSLILELPKVFTGGLYEASFLSIVIGILVSAISGIFAIRVLTKIVANSKLNYFSFYTAGLGCALVLYEFIFLR